VLFRSTKGLLRNIPVNQVTKFEAEFLNAMESKHQNVLDALTIGKYDDELTSVIESIGAEVAKNYKA
jgi:F-type H+-transporting ATPase subunit alpha